MAVAGCGSSKPARRADAPRRHGPTLCLPAAQAIVARYLGVAHSAVTTSLSTGSNAEPQCTYTAHYAGGRRVSVIANVDTAPSPYFRLERTIVESSQTFGNPRLSPAPVAVSNLGLEASWFPAYSWLMATDGTRLMTVTIKVPGYSQSRAIAFGEAVTRPYLHTPTGKAAQAKAMGYPSSG